MKERLDILLVQKNIFESRGKAQIEIEAGKVFVNGQKIVKPSKIFDSEIKISVNERSLKYVGQGGMKLEKAINEFHLNFQNKIVLDIGASTGGFSDCALQNGASLVYAVDVGTGQFSEKLKTLNNVFSYENKDIRNLNESELHFKKMDFIVIDVSFISLKFIFPVLNRFLSQNGEIIALIKPQFEVGRENISKSGVVKNFSLHKKILFEIFLFAASHNFYVYSLTNSPFIEKNRNIEYLAAFSLGKKFFDMEKNIEKLHFYLKNLEK